MGKKTHFAVFGVLVVAFIMGSFQVNAQDYKFHSLFIYNFTKYVEWPSNKKSGDFIIGVSGKSSITESLIKMADGKHVGDQKMVVKVVNNVEEVQKCHIIFVPQNESGKLDALMEQAVQGSVLVISERPGLGKRGSAINFIIENDKWRFELNLASFEKSNLKVAGELVKLGKQI